MIETWFNQDVKKAVKVQYLDGNVFSQDNNGNKVGVCLLDEGAPVNVAGTISANVIRVDGATVAVSGSSSGNKAWVLLPQSAYAVPGVISVIIKATNSGNVTTLCAMVANVYQSSTDTIIDPGTIIPDISSLIAEIEAAVATIPADYSSLWTSLAPAFSSSASYAVGQYVTYNGGLYRFTSAHSGSWASGDVSAVTIGGEIVRINGVIDGEITTLRNDTNSAISGLRNTIAPEFNASNEYIAGDFVYHEGGLYKIMSDHAAGVTWENTNKASATIDAAKKHIYEQIAPQFSSSASYLSGQYVVRNNNLYRFIMDHSGAWSSSDVVAATLGNDIFTGSELVNNDRKNLADLFTGSYERKFPVRNAEWLFGYYIKSNNGESASNSSYAATDYIPVEQASNYHISGIGNCYGAFYNSNKEYLSQAVKQDSPSDSFSINVTSPDNAKYIRISCLIAYINDLVVNGTTLKAYLDDDYHISNDNLSVAFLSQKACSLDGIAIGKNHFNKADEVQGKYILRTLAPTTNAAYNYSFLKRMKPQTTYTVSNRPGNTFDIIVSFFDAEGINLGFVTTSTFTTPANTETVALSYRVSGGSRQHNKETMMVEEGSTETTFEAFVYDLNNKKDYVVDINGSGDFTSLTECVLTAIRTQNAHVLVMPGTYDIISEYQALYGNDFFTNYPQNPSDVGIMLRNGITVEFSPNAFVVCEYTGSNTNVQNKFSPINAGPDGFTLINAHVTSKKVRYSVHDERSGNTDYYVNHYIGCHFIHDKDSGSGYIQALGGGLGKNGKIIIEDCIFESNNETGAIVSYHNAQVSGARSDIVIKDTVINGTIRFSWYGESTLVSTMLVTNCKLLSEPFTTQETSSYNIENVEIIKWNNAIG